MTTRIRRSILPAILVTLGVTYASIRADDTSFAQARIEGVPQGLRQQSTADAKPGTPAQSAPLTPKAAARKAGEICRVSFRVETAARITDITDKTRQQPLEVLLVDTPNNDIHTTPTERANIVVRIPISALAEFKAASMDELARRFEGRTVVVTGNVEAEPHPFRRDSRGDNELRPRITIHTPAQITVQGK